MYRSWIELNRLYHSIGRRVERFWAALCRAVSRISPRSAPPLGILCGFGYLRFISAEIATAVAGFSSLSRPRRVGEPVVLIRAQCVEEPETEPVAPLVEIEVGDEHGWFIPGRFDHDAPVRV